MAGCVMTLLTVVFLSMAPIDEPTMRAVERIAIAFAELRDGRDARLFSEIGAAVLHAQRRNRCDGDLGSR